MQELILPVVEQVMEQESFSSEAKDEMIIDFAKSLASSMEDVEVRSFLKEAALKKFDGDYDIFFHTAKDEPISVGDKQGRVSTQSFAEVLFGGDTKSSAAKSTGENSLKNYLSRLQQAHPLLQIAIPELPNARAESWDIATHTPLVVCLSSDYDEKTTEFVKAFDSKGNVHMIDAVNPPDELLVVVSQNERLMAIERAEFTKMFSRINARCPIEPYYETENTVYVLNEDYYNNECVMGPITPSPPPPPSGGGGGTSSCDRDGNSKDDHVNRIKFVNIGELRNAEPYLSGNPELYVVVILGLSNPSGFTSLRKYISSTDRSKWKDCGIFTCEPEWFNANQVMFNYDDDVFGSLLRYDWWEADNGQATVTYSVSLTTEFKGGQKVTGSVSIVVKAVDDNLGNEFVNYCHDTDGIGRLYDTGKIFFNVNQQ